MWLPVGVMAYITQQTVHAGIPWHSGVEHLDRCVRKALLQYLFKDSKLLTFVLSSPLVFLTDFWHFLKFIMLNSIYGIIILLIEVDTPWYWLIIGMNFAWGVIFEFTSGVYGVFADKKKFD